MIIGINQIKYSMAAGLAVMLCLRSCLPSSAGLFLMTPRLELMNKKVQLDQCFGHVYMDLHLLFSSIGLGPPSAPPSR
jgi:hypothetical protein